MEISSVSLPEPVSGLPLTLEQNCFRRGHERSSSEERRRRKGNAILADNRRVQCRHGGYVSKKTALPFCLACQPRDRQESRELRRCGRHLRMPRLRPVRRRRGGPLHHRCKNWSVSHVLYKSDSKGWIAALLGGCLGNGARLHVKGTRPARHQKKKVCGLTDARL